MKERELREVSTCAICSEKIGKSGLPLFWRVNIKRYGVDMKACERQHGLAMMLGSVQLAAVMGPDEEMATEISDVTITVCETCCTKSTCVAALAERS